MDAREYFREVASANYLAFARTRSDLRLLWNAVVSMNSVAEWVALHRLNYPPGLGRRELDDAADAIRQGCESLRHLLHCANTLKHVRRLSPPPKGLIPSSTGLSTASPWLLDGINIGEVINVEDVLDRAYADVLGFPELAPQVASARTPSLGPGPRADENQ